LTLNRGPTARTQIFGDEDVLDAVSAFCERWLGAPLEEELFQSVSVGVVVGARLADGRRVVIKAHQPRQSRELLEAVVRVQRHHHDAGFPCPRPLAGPAPLGAGLGVAEELLDRGELRDTHVPRLRRAMAELLVRHLELAARHGPEPALARSWDIFAGPGLWPAEPHSPEFDFEATAAGADWIDAIAAEARALAAAPGRPVAAHMDWSGEHFRFEGDEVTAVYDWESLALRPEAQVVGVAAATFTANPALMAAIAPAPEETHAFVDEYDAARGDPLKAVDRERVAAMATYVIAYIARCEHALGGRAHEGSFTAALRRHGLAYLRKPS
jgi:hypothetical protein